MWPRMRIWFDSVSRPPLASYMLALLLALHSSRSKPTRHGLGHDAAAEHRASMQVAKSSVGGIQLLVVTCFRRICLEAAECRGRQLALFERTSSGLRAGSHPLSQHDLTWYTCDVERHVVVSYSAGLKAQALEGCYRVSVPEQERGSHWHGPREALATDCHLILSATSIHPVLCALATIASYRSAQFPQR